MITDKNVVELVNSDEHHKVWLCPDHASDNTFQNNPLLKGIECTRTTVPEKIKNKKVEKYFIEDGFLCIIWKNDGDVNSAQ